ncbi:MAG TPA: phospholipid carrier-dependent glycosyltransferase [Promineifilum sp.]|nr:phospholipid carrier-dependent glycosyltransferase [Promineifilum sp.]
MVPTKLDTRRPGRAAVARVWLAAAALLLFFFLAVNSLVGDSPTMDEQNHIARGLAFLRTGDPRLSLEHPPLINALSALPLLTMPELRLPTDHASWERREGWYEFADLFLWQYNHDVGRIVFLARLPVVFLLMGLALTGYRYARALWGAAAGLPALCLLLFEPNLLAHGRYATTDMGGTLFTFLATALLWRLWQEPERWNWRRWAWAALAVGLAVGSKMTALGFVPIWVVLALLPLYPVGGRGRVWPAGRRLAQLAAAGLVALVVLWAIYGFQWGNFLFISPALQPLNTAAGPMPTFWAGVEQIARLGGAGRAQSFLLGRFSDSGFVAYFPVAFAVKTPLVLLAAIPLAAVWLLGDARTRRRALFLFAPALLYFALTMVSALNIGYRHALPALPHLLVLVAGLAAPEATGRRLFGSAALGARRLVAATVAVVIGVALWIHPHYLSYFNLAAGGPANGYRVLIDSNVDWGQDLLRLQQWMAETGTASVRLGWFGTADPGYYGLAYEPLPGIGRDTFFRLWWALPFNPQQPEPGVYAISATSLWETPLRPEEKRVYAWFRAHEPSARVGYSILIYDVP